MNIAAGILCVLFTIGGMLAIIASLTDGEWLMGRFPRRYRRAARIIYLLLGCAILVMALFVYFSLSID